MQEYKKQDIEKEHGLRDKPMSADDFKPVGEASSGLSRLLKAAKNADWMQVVYNQESPCFHLGGDDRFCLRAERWHRYEPNDHKFVSLEELLKTARHV